MNLTFDRRVASMGIMSKDEKERMYLYTKILEYEQDTVSFIFAKAMKFVSRVDR